MMVFRSMIEQAVNPTNILADAAAMSLRAQGTALRSRAVSNLLRHIVDAGRGGLLQIRNHLIGNCGKAPCTGC